MKPLYSFFATLASSAYDPYFYPFFEVFTFELVSNSP